MENGIRIIDKKLPYLEAKVIRGKSKPIYKYSGVEVNKDDKVILVDGENSGEVMNIPFQGYMGSTFKLLKITNVVIFNYLLYIFFLYKEKYKNSKTGSAIPHLNKDLFKNILIPIPPKKEQLKICNKINLLFQLI